LIHQLKGSVTTKKTRVREQLFLIYITANIRNNCSLTRINRWFLKTENRTRSAKRC